MKPNDLASPQSPPADYQRQVIKTKTLGRTGQDVPDIEYKEVAERQEKQKQNKQNKSDERAQKAKDKILERASEMRHLKYEIIEDADIVQVSVINSEDGTIVRKVPPDKVVGLVKGIREKFPGKKKLDVKA